MANTTGTPAGEPIGIIPSPDEPAPDNQAAHLSCPACRTLDASDGVVDGHLFTPRVPVRNEKTVLQSIQGYQDRVADRVTGFAGSLSFVYLHSVWFGIWIALNIGLFGAAATFDKFPFGLLTMIVSLEAIFLSTFVMVSQNRQAARADVRSQLDFETNLRSEIWAVHIGARLGVSADHVEDVIKDAIAAANTESG